MGPFLLGDSFISWVVAGSCSFCGTDHCEMINWLIGSGAVLEANEA